MHARSEEQLTNYEVHRAVLKSAFDAVPAERRNQPPRPGSWSPAAVVEHLALVEGRVAEMLSRRIGEERASNPAGPAEKSSSDQTLRTLDLSRIVDRSTRLQAPDFAQPTGLDASAAWSQLEQATAALRAMLQSGDGLELDAVMHPHSRLGPMSVYGWIAFLAAHESRHAEQIREMTGPDSVDA